MWKVEGLKFQDYGLAPYILWKPNFCITAAVFIILFARTRVPDKFSMLKKITEIEGT